MDNERSSSFFFVAILILVTVLVGYLFLPTLNAIALGTVFAIVLRPVYDELRRMVRDHDSLNATLALCIGIVVIVVPIIFLASIMFSEAQVVYETLTSDSGSGITAMIRDRLGAISPLFVQFDPSLYTRDFLVWIIGNIGPFFSQIAYSAITALLSAFTAFYLLRDGERLREEVIATLPLARHDTENIIDTLTTMIASVIRGTLVVAVAQGVIVGVGFYFFGLQNSVLWGTVSVFCALVPFIGAGIVYLPTALLLWGSGHTLAAIGFALWGFLLCGSVDNFVRPRLITRGAHINPLLILLSVIGGLSIFGPMGLVLGPLILSLFLALLKIYPTIHPKRIIRKARSKDST